MATDPTVDFPADPVVEYLKAAKLYDTFAVAAGVAKDATAGDVHVSSAGADDEPGKKKKPPIPPVVSGGNGPAAGGPGGGDAQLAKRIAKADIVFAKGDANLYVSRPLTTGSAQALHDWADAQGIKNLVPPNLMHVTQVHSKDEVDTTKFTPQDNMLDAGGNRWLSQLGKGNALVMFFDSPEMQQRHQDAKAAGASWDFQSYQPHVTLSYDTGDVDAHSYGMTKAPDLPIKLGPENFAASNDDWTKENGLAKADFGFSMKITKMDVEKQVVLGWASVTHIGGKLVVDKQDEAIQLLDDPTDQSTGLETAAYNYMLEGGTHGTMHSIMDTGRPVESIVFTPEKAEAGLIAKNEKGEQLFGWWVGFKIDDAEVWKAIKNKDLGEFSIGGRAFHEEMTE